MVLVFFAFSSITNGQVTVTGADATTNAGSPYGTLAAAFTSINGQSQTGNTITITITSDVTDNNTATLNAGAWTSLTITTSGGGTKTLQGSTTTAIIDLNGADNVIIDGRPGGVGVNELNITNTSTATGGSAIRFINDASTNIVRYVTLRSSFSSATTGVVVFSTTTGTNGNDNNIIEFCNINGGAAASASPTSGVAQNGIYSLGTTTSTAHNNSGNTISNCNIYDFYVTGATSTMTGILVGAGNTDWTISTNSVYQTNSRTATTGASTINAITVSSGNNHSITGNFIGGSTSSAGGTAWTQTLALASRFVGINLAVGTTAASSVQNNTIANFNWSTTSGATGVPGIWCGIYMSAGNVLVGTVTGNTIGSGTGTGSVQVTTSTTGGVTMGIVAANGSGGTANIQNNAIGSFTLNGSTTTISHTMIAINVSSVTNLIINSNTIGSTSTPNSINLATVSTSTTSQAFTGILSATGLPTALTINSNTIANVNNAYNSTGGNSMRGIVLTAGVGTISGNTIRNLTTSSAGVGTTTSASIFGISMTSTTAPGGITVTQNTIHSLSNTNTTASNSAYGIYYAGPTTGTNVVSRNNIHSISIATTSTSGILYGIFSNAGTTTYMNNFIRLGIDAAGNSITNPIDIRGINEPLGTDNFYNNSVYIGGSGVTGATATWAFNSIQTTNTRIFRNNIFWNARSNGSGTGKHYAVRVGGTAPNPTGLTINNNLYYTSGIGGVFGFFNSLDVANLGAWQTAVGQDANSFSGANPQFINATGNASTVDLHINTAIATIVESNAASIGAVTDDFDGNARGVTPDLGADEGTFIAASSMSYISSTVTQTNTSTVFTNTTNQEVIGLQIVTSGVLTPLSLTSLDLNITGTNVADIANAKIWYTGASSTFATTTQFGTTIAVPAASQTVGGTQVLEEGTNYFWLTYDVICGATTTNVIDGEITSVTVGSAQTPTVTAPTGSRTIAAGPLSGTYTVGSGGTYATLTAAVADMVTKGLGGNTTFSILNGTVTEPAGVTINQWTECGGSGFTLTISPAAGATSTITASSPTATILINAANRVIIDGSNNGSTSRNMTIANTNTSTSSAVVWGRNGSSNNTFKNLVVQGNASTTTFAGLGFGGSTINLASNSTAANNSNTFQNNDVRAVQYGIVSHGFSTASRSTGTIITQNVLNNSSINAIGKVGISVRNDDGVQVSQNLIGNISNGSSVYGISLGNTTTNSYNPGTLDEIINATVTRNTITTVGSTGGTSAIGILLAPATTGTSEISNNAISNINGGATPSDIVTGIFVGAGNGSSTNVWFNSVYMSGGGSLSRTSPSSALSIGNSFATPTVNIRNNVLVNTSTASGAASAATGAYAFVAYGTSFTGLTFDYNCLFVSGTHSIFAGTGTMPSLTAQANLTALNTTISGGSNSISADPQFNSTTNVTPLTGSPVENVGVDGTGISVDINGVARDASPHMGAYEVSGDAVGPIINSSILTSTALTTNRTVIATITDINGVATGANQPLIYYRKGTSGAYFSSVATSIAGNDYTFTIDYANVTGGSVTAGDVVNWYIAAQDALGNVSTSPIGGSGSTPPGTLAPGTPSSYLILPNYVWQGTTSDFQVSTNWSPTRTTPSVQDILTFDGAVTSSTTVTNIPTQTIGRLVFQNNVTATLNATIGGNDLTISGANGETVLNIQAGSMVNIGTTTSLDLIYGATAGQLASIAGTLNLDNASTQNFANAITTVSGTYGMNGTATISGGTISSLVFAATGVLNFTKASGTIPTATYNFGSNINVTGITAGTSLTSPATIGGLTYNCTGQTSAFSLLSTTTTINGNFNLVSTGSGSFQTGTTTSTTVAIAGNVVQSGGTWNMSGNIISVAGTFTQNGGTFLKTSTSTQSLSAQSFTQGASGIINAAAVAGLWTITATTGDATFNGTINAGTSGGTSIAFTHASNNQTLTTNTVTDRFGLTVNKAAGRVILANSVALGASNVLALTAGILDLNGNTLTINGTALGSGTIRGSSTSNLSIGGTGALGTLNLDQTTDGSTNILNNFTLNRITSGTATLGNKTVVTGVLTLTDGTLTTGGFLHLRSTSAGTARVAPVLGAISGNATVERFLPAGRKWRFLTAPITQTTPSSLNATWQAQVDIVGPSGSNLSTPTPPAVAYNFLTYDAPNDAWVNVSDPTLVNLTGTSLNNAFAAFIPGPAGTNIPSS
ncbi:MAG: BNR-repeat neuraminidase N-terminal domain-containing protein, partial [Dolichospermum sp.]